MLLHSKTLHEFTSRELGNKDALVIHNLALKRNNMSDNGLCSKIKSNQTIRYEYESLSVLPKTLKVSQAYTTVVKKTEDIILMLPK